MGRRCAADISTAVLLLALSAAAFACSFRMPCGGAAARAGICPGMHDICIQMPEMPVEDVREPAAGGAVDGMPYGPVAPGMDLDVEEAGLLARIAMAEAEGEDVEGKALVIRTVLNRVEDEMFPDSIRGVLMQEGQFAPVSDGRFDIVVPDEDCWSALELVVRDMWDPSMGATYFESRSGSTWHMEHLEYLFRHGKHYFYKDWE